MVYTKIVEDLLPSVVVTSFVEWGVGFSIESKDSSDGCGDLFEFAKSDGNRNAQIVAMKKNPEPTKKNVPG